MQEEKRRLDNKSEVYILVQLIVSSNGHGKCAQDLASYPGTVVSLNITIG